MIQKSSIYYRKNKYMSHARLQWPSSVSRERVQLNQGERRINQPENWYLQIVEATLLLSSPDASLSFGVRRGWQNGGTRRRRVPTAGGIRYVRDKGPTRYYRNSLACVSANVPARTTSGLSRLYHTPIVPHTSFPRVKIHGSEDSTRTLPRPADYYWVPYASRDSRSSDKSLRFTLRLSLSLSSTPSMESYNKRWLVT